VAGTLHGGESVSVFNFPVTSGGAIDVPRLPMLVGAAVEIVEAFLGDGERHGGDVDISGVDQDVQIGAFLEELFVEGEHRGEVTGVVDLISTGIPGGGSGVDSILDSGCVQIVRQKSVDRSALRDDGGVLDGEIEGTITGTEVLVEIIRVDAGKRESGRASGSNFLVESSDLTDGGVVDLEARNLEVVGVATVVGPVGIVGVRDKSMPVIEVELSSDGVISTSEDWVSNHEALEGGAELDVGSIEDLLSERRNINSSITLS